MTSHLPMQVLIFVHLAALATAVYFLLLKILFCSLPWPPMAFIAGTYQVEVLENSLHNLSLSHCVPLPLTLPHSAPATQSLLFLRRVMFSWIPLGFLHAVPFPGTLFPLFLDPFHLAHSHSSFKCQSKCHLLGEVFPDPQAKLELHLF